MNQRSYDYSKHTVEELGDEVSIVDAKAQPERATALYRELHRRLVVAQEDVNHAVSEQALAEGARFDQLDAPTRRRFFWPYFWFQAAFGIAYAVALLAITVVVAVVIIAMRGSNGADPEGTTRITQIVVGLLLAVPMSAWWLRQKTKRAFGGYCLRIVPKRE
jgi:hypothetical protein